VRTKLVIIALALTVIPLLTIYAQDGAELFRNNCGACHTVGKGKLVGPDLKMCKTGTPNNGYQNGYKVRKQW